MSYNHFIFVHMYGIVVGEYDFRKEINEIYTDYGIDEQYEILNKIFTGIKFFPKNFLHANILDTSEMELVQGPGYIDYIGYRMLLPYEQRIMTKNKMDENIHNLAIFLYGEKIAKKIHPKEIFEIWSE